MSLLTPGLGLIFWMILIFGAVFFVLAKFGFPVITSMVRKRSDHIEESLRKAEQAQLMLENVEQQQKKLIEEAKAEQSKILKEATELKDKILTQSRLQAQEEADKILARAREEIASERENVMREINSSVSLLSMRVAEKILRKELDTESSQLALIDRFVEEISQNESGRKS